MSVVSTGNIAKLLWPGLNARWGANYTEHPTEYTDLVDVFSSDMTYEEDQEMTGFGMAPVKPQGQPTVYDTMSQGVTSRYTHVAYGLGFIITREAIDDNQYEKVGMQRTGSLAFSMRQTKENVVANLYNRAFNSSYVGGDGVALLSTAHPSVAGNWSNKLATDADLSEASLEDLVIQIGQAKNSRGMRISIKPKSLVIPVQLQFEAARILKSVQQSGTANNDINALRTMGAFPDGIKVNHYLTDADAFFIRTDAPESLKLFQRVAAEFAQDKDFDSDNLKYKAYERYSTGWSDPRGLYGSAGA
ncbi:Mu-like prophage major head subunit gpT family protein [Novosphingobium sp. KN65.2]|uniref:phage major capsid protein n=1 Tax=Novosphingobium sp. KN65.2 TaxID=1478134 RepID=UPI0005E3D4DD|nr:Mu-like prophage major head subunit gpT family protein [Novosphingobium sp. KN65.2]CDO34436.1 conserved hypothetical protein [Novosphingobium sp. KN65.2]